MWLTKIHHHFLENLCYEISLFCETNLLEEAMIWFTNSIERSALDNVAT